MTNDDSGVRVPDLIGEVVGWRAWQIVGSLTLPRLMSVNAARTVGHDDAIWPTKRWLYARCPKKTPHTDVPHEKCSCGLYAAKDREHLVKLGYGAYGAGDVHVIGEVAFKGKVIEGTQGWKAEAGRIKSLVLPYEHWRYADPLAEAYNVPVVVGFLFSDDDRQRAFKRRD